MPGAGPLTVHDLDGLPDDGRRWELLDGLLLVSPGPAFWHQRAGFRLAMLLEAACPAELVVIPAPFDWRISDSTMFEPDILVARLADVMAVEGQRFLAAPPVLAVEVISPSSRRVDRLLKPAAFAEGGAASYWLVDPNSEDPSVETYDLVEPGGYRPGAQARGDESLTVTAPFPLSFTPRDLVDRPRQ